MTNANAHVLGVRQMLAMPVRKTEAALMLHVHRNTITKWHRLAKQEIEAYRKHFEASRKKEQAPLTPYQFWVLERLKKIFSIYRDEELVAAYVKANPDDFSAKTWFIERKQSA